MLFNYFNIVKIDYVWLNFIYGEILIIFFENFIFVDLNEFIISGMLGVYYYLVLWCVNLFWRIN